MSLSLNPYQSQKIAVCPIKKVYHCASIRKVYATKPKLLLGTRIDLRTCSFSIIYMYLPKHSFLFPLSINSRGSVLPRTSTAGTCRVVSPPPSTLLPVTIAWRLWNIYSDKMLMSLLRIKGEMYTYTYTCTCSNNACVIHVLLTFYYALLLQWSSATAQCLFLRSL